LPLALSSEALARAAQDYLDALKSADELASDVIGTVFAINGHFEGADIYESNGLFRAAWPKLLHAYVTQAIATLPQSDETAVPSLEQASAFLDAAQPAGMPERLLDPVDLARATGVYSVASRPDGRWVHRSYLRKFDGTEVASTPEATILGMLESGR